MILIPAIYPEYFEEIIDKLYIIGDLSKLVQIDICDGSYGLRVSWSPLGKEILPDTCVYEFDLILTEWREYLDKAYKLGVKRVVIHVDEFTDADYEELFARIHSYGMVLGITISNDISVDVLVHAINRIERSRLFQDFSSVFVQVTGMRNLATNVHPFDERALSRIRIIKRMFPTLTLQVSGRINPDTAKLVKQAGADRLVVGSYIFGHEDIYEALANLKKALEDDLDIMPEQKHVETKQEELAVVPSKKKIIKKKEKLPKYTASKADIVYNIGVDDEFGSRT